MAVVRPCCEVFKETWLTVRTLALSLKFSFKPKQILVNNLTLNFVWLGGKKGMTPSLHGPYRLGYTCATMIMTKRSKGATLSKSLKVIVCGLFFAIQEHEVGIASNRKSARCGERFTGFGTHCPSRHGIQVAWIFFLVKL